MLKASSMPSPKLSMGDEVAHDRGRGLFVTTGWKSCDGCSMFMKSMPYQSSSGSELIIGRASGSGTGGDEAFRPPYQDVVKGPQPDALRSVLSSGSILQFAHDLALDYGFLRRPISLSGDSVLHFREVVLLGTPGFSRLQAEHFGRVLSHLTLRERQVEHAFDRGLIVFLLICCKNHRKKKARPSHQIGKYARPRRPKASRFAHTGELLLGSKPDGNAYDRRTHIEAAFSAEFAQEVKAEVGFSPCDIGVFGQTGVFKFSLSFLSAKGFSQMAEQRSPLSSANTCSFWESCWPR
ncbi:hypothetical protein KCU62_g172, partial [Aureobasidium sp. EXF-3399]